MPSDVQRTVLAHYEGGQGREYHDAKFAIPAGANPWVTRVRAKKFARYIGATDSVVEFGVGAGWNLAALQCRERVGIDIGEHLAPVLQSLGIRFVSASTALPDASAEVTICHHVLEHVLHPADTLAELLRILVPGGRLLLFVPYEIEGRYRRHHPDEPNHHIFAWNAQTLGNLVTDCGFRVMSADVIRYGYERVAAVWAHKLGVGELGFRSLRCVMQTIRPAREVRVVAIKPRERA